jgi:hypothetical protein
MRKRDSWPFSPASVAYDASMLLVGTNDNRFELTVVGYEFPAIEHDEEDGNWLIITVDVESERGSWTATHPSLLTGEAEWLADWLDDVAEDLAEDAEIGFAEPNLTFERDRASGKAVSLRVRFGAECRPPWAAADDRIGERDLWVRFDLAKADVRRAARDLRGQLREFPPRAVHG